ncbi:DUF4261 domain-containing protein [Winogradskyella sp.]|uniref:immunity protein Imm33 domain-containing protein n=1 Tax=Winogradskyella sp. TaxID=1883156 RepID=UPI002610AC8C|nr:DUF4261 domain-containing protein [Winogradskyella sp.]
MYKYSIIEIKDFFVSQGLDKIFTKEFIVNKGDYTEEDVKFVLDYIIEYFVDSNSQIKNGQTFGFGSWLLQFIFDREYIKLMELKDIDKEGNNLFQFSLSNSIKLYREQFSLCERYGLTPSIPRIGQKIALTTDVYDGSEVNAVRYDSPEHMSGWYLTSNDYDGDIDSLSIDYLFYVIKRRPDLAKFLALPSGYRFFLDAEGSEVWKDE